MPAEGAKPDAAPQPVQQPQAETKDPGLAAPAPPAQVQPAPDAQNQPDAVAKDTTKSETPPAEPISKGLGAEADDASTDTEQGAEGAPEKYEAFALPDGMQMDEAALAQFSPIAKELGLSQQKAQQLVTLYADQVRRQEEEIARAFEEQDRAWIRENKKSPTYDADVKSARRVLSRFGGQEMFELVSMYGLSHNPVFLKFVAGIAKQFGEDVLVKDTAPQKVTQQPKTQSERWYGYMDNPSMTGPQR